MIISSRRVGPRLPAMVNGMTKKDRESWTLVLVAIAGAGRRWLGSGQAVLPSETERTHPADRPQCGKPHPLNPKLASFDDLNHSCLGR
jgi:hypothetical protein